MGHFGRDDFGVRKRVRVQLRVKVRVRVRVRVKVWDGFGFGKVYLSMSQGVCGRFGRFWGSMST